MDLGMAIAAGRPMIVITRTSSMTVNPPRRVLELHFFFIWRTQPRPFSNSQASDSNLFVARLAPQLVGPSVYFRCNSANAGTNRDSLTQANRKLFSRISSD